MIAENGEKNMGCVSRKDSFFGFHADFHAHKNDLHIGENVTQEMIERFLEAVQPDYVQVDCKGHFGYSCYPTKIGYAPPGLKNDLLAIWRKATKKHGVELVVHFSGLIDKAAIDHHPEWATVHADGEIDPFCTSPFGPYVDEHMIPQLKEVITEYDIDAVWVDGECWAAVPDYGKKALDKFKDKTGIESIPKSQVDPYWKEFLAFNRARFKEFVKHYVDEIHKFKPEMQITSNVMFGPWMPEPLTIPIDFLSGDYKPVDGVELARLAARYLPSVGLPWDIMTWGNTKGQNQYNISLRPAIQLKQEAASVLAQGGGWQFVAPVARSGYIDDGTTATAADLAKFCRERQSLCHKTQSVPQVALLFPTTSTFDNLEEMYYFTDDMRPSLIGPLHGLLELHYSVDVKAEHWLSGHLQDYPVIIVPECHLLPEDFIAELRKYVHQGGRLLLCGPQVSAMFKDDLGVSFEGDMIDMDQLFAELEKTVVRREFIVLEPDLPQLYITHDSLTSPCPGRYQKVTPTTAKPINYCYFRRDLFGEKMCASTVVRCGEGVVGAIYVPLMENYYESHLPVLRDAFSKIMTNVFPEPMVKLEAPPCIDMSIKKKDDMVLIHLVNLSGLAVTAHYAAADYVLPVVDIGLEVRLDAEPSEAKWAYGGNSKTKQYQNGTLSIVLDRLEIHDTLVIKPVKSDDKLADLG